MNLRKYIILYCFVFLSLFTPQELRSQVLDYKTYIKVEQGKKITEKFFLIQINNKTENWLSKIQISHSPKQQFSLLAATVINANGEIVRKLRKKEIHTKSNLSYGAFYQDDLIEEFNLFWNEYPYQIQYAYQINETNFLYLAKWYPIGNSNVKTTKSSLMIEIPLGYKVSLDYSEELNYQKSIIGGDILLSWTYDQFVVPKNEVLSVPLEELVPQVSVVPIDFKYGVLGNSASWSSFGSWLYDLNEGTDELTAAEKSTIDELITGIDDKKQIVKTLYYYLQDKTKYINVAIDVGGLKSYPASYVCTNKYGDCKALTTYMKAMLKYVGIPSFYTVINAGENAPRILKNIPSQQFNHVILTVPMQGDTIWLENTSNALPFDYVGTFTQNRSALMVNGSESKLINLPRLEMAGVLENRNYEFSLDEAGKGQLTINEVLGGDAFERYRYYQRQMDLGDQKEKVLRDILVNNFDLTSWEISKSNRDSLKIEVYASGSCSYQIENIGNLKILNTIRVKVPDLEEPERRTQALRVNYPLNQSYSMVYNLPFIKNRETQLPDNFYITNKYGSYEALYSLTDTTFKLQENFKMSDGDYTIENYPEIYSFINQIKTHQKSSTIIIK